ncbi:MAG TPA: AAA family ATPase [Anaerolineae bacterium]|nr:AAA family ATPase [Anaerolineae bacterium]
MIHLRRLAALQFKQLDRVDLELPERARILVKGLNEAGKSTLFEAVFFGLFGQPLGGQGARSLDDLIRYGADSAQVDLTVGLSGGRALEIRRQLRRGKPNIWELDLLRADGGLEEQIRGNREVNLRVAAELGFDAESLLNTCFVEQKKLDKLEGMNRAEREQSLMKLLNLDHLLAVAERLKVRLTDRQALARLTDRRDLARYQEELPRAGTRVGELEADLARLDALGALDAARTQLLGLRAADAELALAREAEAALTAQAAQAQALAEALASLEQARQAARQAAEAAAVAARARELAERCRLARDEELPAVMARGLALRRLARRRDWLNRGAERAEALRQAVARRDAELDVLATDLGALNQTRRDLVEARAAAREAHDAMGGLEQDRRAFEVRAALGEWLAAGEREAVDDGAALAVEGVREERRRLEARQAGLRWGLLAAMAAAAIGLANGLVGGRAGLPAALATALTGGGLLTLVILSLALVLGQQRAAALALRLGRLEGEAAARERDAALRQAAVAAAEARLQAAQAVRPANLDRGRMAMVEIEARLAGRDREGVQAQLTATQTRLIRAQEAMERLGAREAELRAATMGRDGAALGHERDVWAAREARLARSFERRRPPLDALAQSLHLGEAGIDEELGALRARLAELRRLVGELGGAEAEAKGQAVRGAELGELLAEAWARAGQKGAAPAADDPRWPLARAELAEAYERAGGDGLRARLQAAARHGAELAGSRRAAGQSLAAGLRQLGGLIGAAGGDPALLGPWSRPPPAGAALLEAADLAAAEAAMDGARASLGAAPPADRPRLAADLERARGRLQVLRHEIQRLEGELGLAGMVLDLVEAEAALSAAAHDLALRERATRMVEQAGRRVMQGVLPSTLLHMQRILPALTDQRYLEARLTEDLQIEVYDERAGNWRKKNIFSGGAKDQFSLALRLAFAMATLPEERGSAPSFLFLDEPLGAFDPRRAEALIELLTTGEVAQAFDQIFLISHVPVDEERFDRTVALEAGRVVASDLAGGDGLYAGGDGLDLARPDEV